ncbi:hypothetical protein [Litoribacterium kuwaitense]|uniref:hypothetical protein n=1 Tax=Litoribacterium kuwaitense TaxID=1398745 RepID=UPI0028A9246C|nr:hypothetical protein [Litoribacterium kuwaitense]
MKTLRWSIFTILTLLVLAGCGGNNDSNPSERILAIRMKKLPVKKKSSTYIRADITMLMINYMMRLQRKRALKSMLFKVKATSLWSVSTAKVKQLKQMSLLQQMLVI